MPSFVKKYDVKIYLLVQFLADFWLTHVSPISIWWHFQYDGMVLGSWAAPMLWFRTVYTCSSSQHRNFVDIDMKFWDNLSLRPYCNYKERYKLNIGYIFEYRW